ncbi:hypothetical protein CQA66_06660 [Helicobacter aurati]|uniref:Outer membrane beta-barrel protein n=1 Tax=Helicobacter aurati TaxID=137778 RepID=A0A3D8J1I4_9HELI|nr:hypothetical protein [Helicobacter aurati]RDU71348.1 hypothetical protein CQA66_06660 [Helicobacter aurati]
MSLQITHKIFLCLSLFAYLSQTQLLAKQHAPKQQRNEFSRNNEIIDPLPNIFSENTVSLDNQRPDSQQDLFQTNALFFFQAGFGVGLQGFETSADGIVQVRIIPTIAVALGYNQYFHINEISFGLKFMVSYELGLFPSGENTLVYKSGGAYAVIYAGFRQILPYLGLGYDILESGKTFLPAFDASTRSFEQGHSYLYGAVFTFDKNHGIDLSFRHSKFYNFFPRILVNYEFRF